MRRLLLTWLICFAWLVTPVQSIDELHPTPWSVDFLGEQSTLNGQPLPVGTVVRAYDPSGTLAGRGEVLVSGWYLMPVYGDDPLTGLDEGARSGDRIAFTVNGGPALPLGPDQPRWIESGTRVHVELRASTLPGDFDGDCQVTGVDLMRQMASFGASRGRVGYYPPFDLDGDGVIAGRDFQQTAVNWRTTCQAHR
jgi:hypothetical protein